MDIAKFNRKAKADKEALTAFLKKLDELVPEDLPEVVREEDEKVWQETDCLACANCCKTMTPTWTRNDVKRIATHLHMAPKAFVEKWLYKEKESKDWMNKIQPCQFLDLETNMCSVYEFRPDDCREFPHHNKQPFDQYNETFIQNITYCPATYNLVARLKKRIEKEYEWE